MPKLLYTWYFEKFTGSVTSSGHSALRHDVSRIMYNPSIIYSVMVKFYVQINVTSTYNISS